MKNEISASNQAKVQYRLEGETYVFETNIEGGGEYALIFVNSDDSHYTAAVTRAGKTLIQKIEKKRIAAAVKIKIVDVETDAEIFSCPFISKKAADEKPDSEEPQSPPAEPVAVKAEEKPRIHIMEKTDQVKQLEKKYFSKHQPMMYFETCKKILAEHFKPFGGLSGLSDEHVLFAYDEDLSAEHELRLVLNKGIVPMSKLYLHFINRYLPEDIALPARIIGTAVIEGDNYYALGVLGEHIREQQPFMGATGFVYHHMLADGKYGYWFMYINAKTGKISTPLTPVNVW
jgi:ABC-type uncharacterized transport system auxiliary subunit